MSVSFTVSDAGTYRAWGLAADTKPASPPTGSIYIETDTGKMWYASASSWVLCAVYQVAGSYATAAQGATADSALQPAGNGSALTGLTKTQVGLANADNTSDAAKPVSTAQQTALDLKANLAGPTFTGAVGGITATMVGLGSVNNTSDAAKPVSTATQTVLDAKQATLVSGTNIKTVNGSTLLGTGDLAVSAADPSYSPGSFTVATGTGRLIIKHMKLTTTERVTLAGTGRLAVGF